MLGTIIGVGVFNLPASLAPFGPISLIALGLTTVGAVALALMFASLGSRMPADGGPYAYARAGFGNLAGFMNAWLYWLTTWGGNAAIATGWVLYVERFVNTGHVTTVTVLLTLAGIWLAVAINLAGIKRMGQIQLWTSVLKFVPLLLISTVGLARAPWPQSAGRWPCACSPISGWSRPPSRRVRWASRNATFLGPRSSARWPLRWSTSSPW